MPTFAFKSQNTSEQYQRNNDDDIAGSKVVPKNK